MRPPAILLVTIVVLGVLFGANVLLTAKYVAYLLDAGKLPSELGSVLFQRGMLTLVTGLALLLIALRRRAARGAVTLALVWVALIPVLPVALGWSSPISFSASSPAFAAARVFSLALYVALAFWIIWVFRSSRAVAAYLGGAGEGPPVGRRASEEDAESEQRSEDAGTTA